MQGSNSAIETNSGSLSVGTDRSKEAEHAGQIASTQTYFLTLLYAWAVKLNAYASDTGCVSECNIWQ